MAGLTPRLRVSGRRVLAGLAAAASLALPAAAMGDAAKNGFALDPSSIPDAEILAGGPPRDGIPALSQPHTIAADAATWLDDEMVIGVVHAGKARAYPIAILVWHELVNDTLGGLPLLVSYCPLCGSALTFDRRVEGKTLDFGVSGLLYRSDLLMFDRQTESLWSQIGAEAVTGPSMGERLELVRSKMDRWGRWKRAHPNTSVLSMQTEHRRPYGESPYGDYDQSDRLVFPAPLDERYHPKMPVVGLRLPGGAARAYPALELRRAGGVVTEQFVGHPVTVRYDLDARVFDVDAPQPVDVIESYWFAWKAFHPESSVFRAPSESEQTTKTEGKKKPREAAGSKSDDD